MASSSTGTTHTLSESRAQALQALLNSLFPGARSDEQGQLNSDQVRKISDKLGELLGEDAMPDVGRRNEKGELVNEEGLPIVDIVEPVPANQPSTTPRPLPTLSSDVLPLWTLSPAEKARRRAERDRILDILEEEERIEREKEEAEERERFQVELQKRKEAAKAEMDALKKAREMQKKMGKALLQNLAAAREREEQEKQALEQAERDAREERKKLKPKKSVTFADLPPDHESQPANSVPPLDWGDVAPAKLNAGKSTLITRGDMNKLPMKMNVVERVPGVGRGPKSPPPPTSSHADSDDESEPGSPVPADSDDGEVIHSDHSDEENPHPPDHDESGESDFEPPQDDEPVEWDIEGYDHAQHQREIALAYYEKRATVGAEALAAMRNHEHTEEEHEWDQPVVPLEATLASSPPKPPVSRFKASLASGSSLPSHSLGASILPSSQSATLKEAVRLGKLEDGQLVGGEEGESEDELDPQAKEMLEMLKKGDVVNVGPTLSTNSPVVPTATSPSTSQTQSTPAEPPAGAVPAPKPKLSKVSQFKMAMGQSTPPRSPASSDSSASTPLTSVERSSPKLGSRSGTPIAVPTKTSRPRPAASSSQAPPRLPPQMPGMIVDSPSFPAPGPSSQAAGKRPMQMTGMIVDSPSFPAPGIIPSPSFTVPTDAATPSGLTAFESAILESPSPRSPTSTVVGTPTSATPSPALSAPTTPRTPVSSSVLERKPPMAGAVKESTSGAAPRAAVGGSAGAGKEKKVSKFAAERM
ncbi:hypothetical protein C8Q77DRAFT_1050663 [Trametes polyzona]|nr:hypothetical protein C8Q77DRAFT_1050663 [Trametes polyzona]